MIEQVKSRILRVALVATTIAAVAGWTMQAASAADLGEFNFTTITDGRTIPANVGEIVVATSISGASNAVVLPDCSAVPSGRRIVVVNGVATGTGTIGVSAIAGQTINGYQMDTALNTGFNKATYVCDGVSAWYKI